VAGQADFGRWASSPCFSRDAQQWLSFERFWRNKLSALSEFLGDPEPPARATDRKTARHLTT
jgi:hypothetical protein